MKIISLLIILCSLLSCKAQTNVVSEKDSQERTKFILIANVGSSNYSVAPLIISTDTINKIEYEKGIYDLIVRFKGFRNVVVNNESYVKLFSHLDVSSNNNVRPNKFPKPYPIKLIIDYRGEDGVDYELLSVKQVSAILYILKNLYCYLENNNFEKSLLDHVKFMHKFYLDTYDRNREVYKSKITCD